MPSTMDKEQFSHLLALGTGEQLAYDTQETFIDAFLRQVEKTPHATAVMDEFGSMSYSELDKRSDFVAAELLNMDVKVGDFVAIKLPRVKEFLVAVLGIWKAGGAYMPVDPTYPEERIRYMLEDAGAVVTIDESWIDRLRCAISTLSVPVNNANPDGTAIVIYTSGSTGKPKGVLTTHGGVRGLCNSMNFIYQYDNEDVIAEIPSFSYVISCSDLFPPLIYGLTIFILNHSLLTDISALDRYIRENGITIITTVPQIGIPLINDFNTPLRAIGMGGAKVELSKQCDIKIISGYGLSETCSAVSFVYLLDKLAENGPMLGRPTPGVTIVLEDEDGNPVPQGEIGEVCIGAPQVAAGYWLNEELTAEKFVNRPWSQYKVFRSGDLGRWNKDGVLEFHGRKDDMVKIRGNRVELGEVEVAIMKVEGIRAAAAAMKEVNGESLLCGYYVASVSVSPESISTSMSEFLPPYMIPTLFIRMDALPKLPNGKLDRLSLPVPDLQLSNDIVAPQNEFERKVFRIVAREAGTENFGVTTNLISLGLSSLRAIRLSAVLKSELGITIPQAELLAHPVIREWETLCKTEIQTIPIETTREYYPLTDNQLGLFAEWERNRNADMYNLPFVLKINGGDAQKLLYSVQETIKLHPILKMHIGEHDGVFVQIRRDDAQLAVGFESLFSEPDDDFFGKMIRPFNLLGDDLARFSVFSSPKAAWLFFDIHHIIFDGSSSNTLLHTLSSLYRRTSVKQEKVTAFDYALYKNRWKETDEFKEYGRYFESLLADTESFSYPSSVNGTADGRSGRIIIDIPRKGIKELCRNCGVTENSFFAAVLTQVFHRISREKAIQIAMFSSGRSMTELSGSIGMFVQTLPLVSHVTYGTVGEMLRLIHSQIVDTLSRDRYPYTLLAEKNGIKPNVMYVYQGDLIDDVDFGETGHEWHRLPVSSTISPLTVEILPEKEEYKIKFEYDNGLYGEKDMKLLSEVVGTLARGIAQSPLDITVNSISMVSDEKRTSLLNLGTGEKLVYDRSETFVDQFLYSVRQYPDSVAVVDSTSSITYRELDEKSNALAFRLIELGVRKDTFVAIMLPRVKEFMVAVLGTWKAGGAYLPLGSEYPKERLKFMLEDAEASIMITESGIWNDMSDAGLPTSTVIKLDEFSFGTSATSVNNAVADGLSYMIYTSGSTGKPKGTMLEHHNLRAFNEWMVKIVDIQPGEAITEHASFSFDGSCLDLYPALTVGGQVHILCNDIRHDMPAMVDYFNANHIKGCFLTTRLAQELLNNFDLPLEYMMMGGEKNYGFRASKVKVYEVYGPTETTILATAGLTDQTFPDINNIPIGRPAPNLTMCIVDENGQLVPRGMAGELCIAGPQVARGYWKQPELTAQKFTASPLDETERMYHTGDLSRWDENGNIIFLGRIDHQVKLRGFRIEMEEIESALSKYNGITSAVAEVKTVNGIQHLCAYYVANAPIEEDDLKSELAKSLTEYMIPDAFIRLNSLPMTPNGKVDRKALPLPELKADEVVHPQTERERLLFEVVSDELGTDQFGVTTNLISMGLTSIRAIRLSMAIKNRLGLNISTGDILSLPRIRDWQESVSDAIEVAEYRKYYPLTDNQLGIYIDWEQHRDGLQYNIPSAMKFIGVDAEKIVAVLKEVISNHPSLKTRIVQIEGKVMQLRRDDVEIPVLFEHLEEEPSVAFFQSRVCPFDLIDDNLARFEVYQTETAAYLFYDIHHIIFDGSAANVLLSDFAKILSGSGIEPEQVTAFDYALYYDDWKQSDRYGEYEEYFDHLVSDTESFLYPVSSTGLSSKGKSATLTISVPYDKICSFCRGLGITENAFFATVLTQVFHRISREENIQITTISNGRSMEQLSETMGMFVQTLPLVSRKNCGTASDILRDMQQQIVETVRRDKYPFIRLSERHGIKPNVLYAYQGDMIDYEAFSGLGNVEIIPLSLDTAKMPISVNVFPEGENYSLIVEYDEGMYSESDMKLLCNALSVFATSLAGLSPEEDISSVRLTDSSETASLIELGTGERLDYDTTKTFIDLFTEQAWKAPYNIAVVDKDSQLTYKELDEQSNAIAHWLIEGHDIEPNDFVAVMLPRRKEFVTSVLGIWKAGAAYVPIDPEYPEERKRFMMEDCEAKVVITEEMLHKISLLDSVQYSDINKTEPEGFAYMIYTSGSTGKPKGVVVTHENLCAFIAWMIPTLGLKRGDSTAEYASFSFDGSCLDLYPTIAAGGSLYILSEEVRKDIPVLIAYLSDHHIKGMFLPTKFAQMVFENNDLPLEYLIMGGEKNSGVRKTSTRIFEMYGPTEFAVASSFHLIEYEKDSSRIPIGHPVPNSVSLILDTFGNVVPRGISGELCLAGLQLSSGYWRRPELTAEKFVDCPYLPGQKMYKTGDLVRWNEEGQLEYIGRIDNQIKLRGYRIELGEIETAASKENGINQAIALVKNDTLCLYYTGEATEEEIKSKLSKTLTDYMVPSIYIHLDAMPLTPNGKTDRKALPELVLKPAEIIPAATRDEEILLTIARKMLGTDGFGVTDSLIEYGMNSIAAIKFVAAASKEGIALKVGDVLQKASIRKIASSNQTFGFWFHPFDPGKPVFVFTSGFTPWSKASVLLEKLSKCYNVFVFEDLRGHFDAVFSNDNLDEIVSFYCDYLEYMLPKGVKANIFGGHCVGGEIALRLASRYSYSTGEKPSICLWNARLIRIAKTRNTSVPSQNEIDALMNASESQLAAYDDLIRCTTIIWSLKEGLSDLPSYSGAVVYFRALRAEAEIFDISRGILTDNLPNMRFIDIDADHFSILSAENSERCLTEYLTPDV